MLKFPILYLTVLIVFTLSTAQAEVYRYTDEHGNKFYVDNKEKIPRQYRNQLQFQKPLAPISKVPGIRGNDQPSYESQPPAVSYATNKKVEIFVASWCGVCRRLEAFLKEKHIRYQSYDIEKDTVGKNTYQKFDLNSVPVTRIGTKIISGFNPQAILQALGKS